MPSHEGHNLAEWLDMQDVFEEVDAWIDEPFKWMPNGAGHRAYRHSIPEGIAKYGMAASRAPAQRVARENELYLRALKNGKDPVTARKMAADREYHETRQLRAYMLHTQYIDPLGTANADWRFRLEVMAATGPLKGLIHARRNEVNRIFYATRRL